MTNHNRGFQQCIRFPDLTPQWGEVNMKISPVDYHKALIFSFVNNSNEGNNVDVFTVFLRLVFLFEFCKMLTQKKRRTY